MAFFGDNRLFAIFDIDVTGEDKLDALMRKMGLVDQQAQKTGSGMEMMGQGTKDAGDSAEKAGGQFGAMFGIGMNVLFLGMALNMVFMRMSTQMLSMTGASAALGAAMKSVLLPFFIAITPHILKFSQMLMNLPKDIKMIIGGFVAAMTVLGPLLMIVGQAILLFTSFSGSLGAVAAGMSTAIPIIGALIGVGMALFVLFKRFPGVVDFLGSVIANIAKSLAKVFSGLFTMLKGFLTFIIGTFVGVLTGNWDKAILGMKETFQGFVQVLDGLFGQLLDGIIKMLSGLTDAAVRGGKNMIEGLVKGIKSSANLIMDTITSIIPSWVIEGLKLGVLGPAGFAAGAAMDVVGVNDFILSGDKLIQPDKRDTIVGAKPGGPIMSGGGGQDVTVNINDPVMKEDVDVQRVVDEVEDRVNRDTRGRTGLGT